MKNLNNTLMKTAKLWSQESYSTRHKVGAVLVKNGNILVTGYNGTISGESNICEIVDPEGPVQISCPDCDQYPNFECLSCSGTGYVRIQNVTNDFVLHAEQNVICFAAKNGISTDGCDLYITLSPCINCAKLIAQTGIKKVYFNEKYRDLSGVDYLLGCGILCEQIEIKE